MNKARLPDAPVGGKARSLLGVDDLQQVHLPQLELRRAHREVDHPWRQTTASVSKNMPGGCHGWLSGEVKQRGKAVAGG